MIDPCGMIVDYVRSVFTRPMWFHLPTGTITGRFPGLAPNPQLDRDYVLIRWYWAPPGAKELPIPTVYASSDWLSALESAPTQLGEIPRYSRRKKQGEGTLLYGIPRPAWSSGQPPLGATGQTYCGRPEWFNGEVPPGDLARGPGGLPICCNPALGAAIGLSLLAVPSPRQAAIGLTRLNLPASLVLAGPAPAHGRLGLDALPVLRGRLALAGTAPAGASALALAGSLAEVPAAQLALGPTLGTNLVQFTRGQVSGWSIEIFNASANSVSFAQWGGGGFNAFSAGNLDQERWYYIAVSWDTAIMYLWLDGNLIGTAPLAGSMRGAPGGDYWNTTGGTFGSGFWSEVRIYQQWLTPAEIGADAQLTVQAGIVARYPCNDGSGSTVTDVVGGANGTLLSTAGWGTVGPGGGCLDFTSASGSPAVNAPDVLSDTLPYTISFWYRPPPS